MGKYILLSEKVWHKELFDNLKVRFNNDEWIQMISKDEFNLKILTELKPDMIFIPHWSYIIPPTIFKNFECVVFHMTDLPYGRGGSPLQNLIIRGHKSTKISAIKVQEGLDEGDIYLKAPLDLDGTASEIFKRSTNIIEQMISNIIELKISPIPQKGEVVLFERRKKVDGNLSKLKEIDEVYDFIRMLDCEGYPRAYIQFNDINIEFENAKFNEHEKIVTADVRIFKE